MKKCFKIFALLAVALVGVVLVACNKTTTAATTNRPTTTEGQGTNTNKPTTVGGDTTTVTETTTAGHEHAWDEGVETTPATCSQEGVKTYTCACGETKTEPIEKLPHTEEEIPAVEATCTATGLTAGKKCSVCETILEEQTEVEMKAHALGEAKQSNAHILDGYIELKATCGDCGAEEVTQTINLAQYDAKAHATGKAAGDQTSFNMDLETMTITVNKMTEGANQWVRFDFAAYTEAPAKYAYIVLEGSQDMCVGVKFDASNPNNKYDGYSGNKQYKGIQGKADIVVWDLEALQMDSTILTKVVFWPYASKDSGTTTGTIKILGAGLANTAEEIAALHQYANCVGNAEGHAMTCVCGAHLEGAAHTPVTDAAVNPTCTVAGKTEGSHCSACNYVITAQTEVQATGHAYKEVALVEATPIATGVAAHYACDNCELIFDADKNVTTEEALVIEKVTPKTVAEAITEANAASTETVYVKGYVKNGAITGKGIQLYIVDVMGNDQVFQIYNATAAEGVDKGFRPGSLVIAKGGYAVYEGKAELVSSTVIYAENPTDAIVYGTEKAPLTVPQAYVEAAKCINTPKDKCYVKGYVVAADAEKKNITIVDYSDYNKQIIVYFKNGFEGEIVLGQKALVVGQYQAYYEKMEITNPTMTYTTEFDVKLSDGTTPIAQYIGTDVLSFKTYIGLDNITKFDYANTGVVATGTSSLTITNALLKAMKAEGKKYVGITLDVVGGEKYNNVTVASFSADNEWIPAEQGGYYADKAAADGEFALQIKLADIETLIEDGGYVILYFRNTTKVDGQNVLTNVDVTITVKSIAALEYVDFIKWSPVDAEFSEITRDANGYITGFKASSTVAFKEGLGVDASYFEYVKAQGYKFIMADVQWNKNANGEGTTPMGAIGYLDGTISYSSDAQLVIDLNKAIDTKKPYLRFWMPFPGGTEFGTGSVVVSNIKYYEADPRKEAGLVLKVRDFGNDTVNTNQRFGIDFTYYGDAYTGAVGAGVGQVGVLKNENNENATVLTFNRFGGLTKREVVFFANHMNINGYGNKDVSYEGDVVIIPAGTYKDPTNQWNVNRQLVLEENLYYYCPARGKDFIRMASAEELLTKLTTTSQTGNVWQSFDNLIYLAKLLGYTKINFHADAAGFYTGNGANCTLEGFTDYRLVITCVSNGTTKYWQTNGITTGGKDCYLDLTQYPAYDKTTFTVRCWHNETQNLDKHNNEGSGCWKNLDANIKLTNISLTK